jgi:hypothetical protein
MIFPEMIRINVFLTFYSYDGNVRKTITQEGKTMGKIMPYQTGKSHDNFNKRGSRAPKPQATPTTSPPKSSKKPPRPS